MNKQPIHVYESEVRSSPCGFTKEPMVKEYDKYTRIYEYKCGCIREDNFTEVKIDFAKIE